MTFFFFQAEDGIRDLTVTGVQTCALPIFTIAADGRIQLHYRPNNLRAHRLLVRETRRILRRLGFPLVVAHSRSEERRVGKSVDLGGRRIIKKKKEKAGACSPVSSDSSRGL